MVEQIKQAKRDRNTAHFLNYLEAQIDFPVPEWLGKAAARNCYFGLTLVHRSGIFANSDNHQTASLESFITSLHDDRLPYLSVAGKFLKMLNLFIQHKLQ